ATDLAARPGPATLAGLRSLRSLSSADEPRRSGTSRLRSGPLVRSVITEPGGGEKRSGPPATHLLAGRVTMTTNSADVFGEPIHVYTRAQALADGVLVDAGPLAGEAGFHWPVALTQAA